MITILSKDLVNKIAAGEVVERPASVVKELLENALDAGASHITLALHRGGLEEVSVTDDGNGIESQDIPKIFHNHATSKITQVDDLQAIHTFGFRGEALASIASVSEVQVITKYKSESQGSKVTFMNNKTVVLPAAANQGTQIQVRNLFYNIPARRKFMKSEKTEGAYCIKVFEGIALANPHVAFTCYKDGKLLLQLDRVDENERIHKLVHHEFTQFDTLYQSEDLQIEGVLTPPGNLEQNTAQYLYVNKRPITSSIIVAAIKEAYRSYLKKELKPSFVLFLSINPLLVDVNVHPRKTEVRFLDQRKIYTMLYQACVRYFERLGNESQHEQREIPYTSMRQESASVLRDKPIYRLPTPTLRAVKKTQDVKSVEDSLAFTKSLFPIQEDSLFAYTQFLQIDKKFIVFEYKEEIIILDQHAASERVMYEKYIRSFEEKHIDMIAPLFPLTFELDPADHEFILDHLEQFHLYGFVLEDMGNGIIAVVEHLSSLRQADLKDAFFELLDILKEGYIKDHLKNDERIIASLACRSAVMFGQTLSQDEIRNLVEQLYDCKISFTCAHGRPVRVSLPFNEILKKMARC